MKRLNHLPLLLTAGLIISCQSNNRKPDTGHQSHTDSVSHTGYTMLFTIIPDAPKEGLPVTFMLKPVKENTDSIVALEIQHEKKIHFIIVAGDLSSFRHLHPAEQPDGSYTITDTFMHGGDYILYADYQPAGAAKQVTMHRIKITGQEEKKAVYNTQMLKNSINGYTVTLKPEKDTISYGKEQMMLAEIADAKGVLTPDKLENYLGEKAHMVIIGVRNKNYLHVHPMVMGNELMLHASFSEPGMYRAWLEFKINGKVNAADFVIKAN